ncbi:Glycosyltransferase involved in cell wall bisynthesis [Arachidicoccus rhizosphaerae]|uniref:Glycosyltransferase involved in cell wall bisynthesis n=1 Tax=Arachidicoccus rhizosphaerae TaxID=551991 RepID=A0A1H4CNS7_9BACT|nr:glycosyltransferase family 4 protein [Arachidicoccus rhizosphaerae]SEA62085.1 Glycosyltransferase involved in cell wall bisynthesis [Arachidicoccus rhizosphaerae]
MKVLQIIPNLAGGGAERFVVDLCNELVRNHEVHLVTLYDLGDDDFFKEKIDSKVKTMSLNKKESFDLSIFGKLYRCINTIRPDIIHCHLRSLNYLMPIIFAMPKMALIHTVHNDAFIECPSRVIRFARKIFFRGRKRMAVTISQESSNSFVSAYGDLPYKQIFNGSEILKREDIREDYISLVEAAKKGHSTKVFVNIGRLVKQKNQLMLVRAFEKLIKNDKADAILLIIGGKRSTQESLSIENELLAISEVSGNIHLLGERKNAVDFLFLADFFCLSSIYEGMPISLIESFGVGLIPVCTPVGGVPEMITLLDGTLLAKGVNEEDYYQALKAAFQIPADRKRYLQEKAIQVFRQYFSIEHCADNYLQLYKELLTNASFRS